MHNLDWLCRSACQWYVFSPLNRLNLFFQGKQNLLLFHMKSIMNVAVADLDLWDTSFGWSCHCCSVAKSCPPLGDTMGCSTPGTFVFHIYPEFAWSPICWISDLSNPLIFCGTFSLCLQSFPTSGSFPMSQFFASGGQSIGASASASVLLMNIQGWFPLGWATLISLQSQDS